MNLPDSKELQELIRLCRKNDRKAQERLFKISYPLALSVCRRYTRDLEEAQSVVNEGMLKVFRELDQYTLELPFGGWVRRIMVNTSIDHYRKIKRYLDRYAELDTEDTNPVYEKDILDHISADEILTLVQDLSPAYQMVFSLYAVEGYTHREIAEKLGISEGTSKSNYAKARAKLQKSIALLHTIKQQQNG
jgi:RNA polymerase sigma-70 factor (ECF subfamily)